MKPRNFPERKRQRQLSALERLQNQLPELEGRDKNRVLDLINVLEDKTHTSLLNKRTKKRRGIGVKSSTN